MRMRPMSSDCRPRRLRKTRPPTVDSLLLLALRLLFLLDGLIQRLLVAIANHMQAHEVRCARLRPRTGDDADNLTPLDVAQLLQNSFGHANQFVCIAEACAQNG